MTRGAGRGAGSGGEGGGGNGGGGELLVCPIIIKAFSLWSAHMKGTSGRGCAC